DHQLGDPAATGVGPLPVVLVDRESHRPAVDAVLRREDHEDARPAGQEGGEIDASLERTILDEDDVTGRRAFGLRLDRPEELRDLGALLITQLDRERRHRQHDEAHDHPEDDGHGDDAGGDRPMPPDLGERRAHQQDEQRQRQGGGWGWRAALAAVAKGTNAAAYTADRPAAIAP